MSLINSYTPIVCPNPNDGINSILPVGSMLLWSGSTAPTNFLLCDGSAFLPDTYPALYSIIGNTYSTGGSPTAILFTTVTLTSGAGVVNYTSGTNTTIKTGDTFVFGNIATYTGTNLSGLSFVCTGTPALTTLTFSSTLADGIGYSSAIQRTSFNIPDTRTRTIRGVGANALITDATYTLGSTGGVTAGGRSDNVTLASANVPSHAHIGNANTMYVASVGTGNVTGNGATTWGTNATAKSLSDIYDASGNQVTGTNSVGARFSVVNTYLAVNYIIKSA